MLLSIHTRLWRGNSLPKDIILQVFMVPKGQHDPWIMCCGFGTAIKRIAVRKGCHFQVSYGTDLLCVTKLGLSRKDWTDASKKQRKEIAMFVACVFLGAIQSAVKLGKSSAGRTTPGPSAEDRQMHTKHEGEGWDTEDMCLRIARGAHADCF